MGGVSYLVNCFVDALLCISLRASYLGIDIVRTVVHQLSTVGARKPKMTILAVEEVTLLIWPAKSSGVFSKSNRS